MFNVKDKFHTLAEHRNILDGDVVAAHEDDRGVVGCGDGGERDGGLPEGGFFREEGLRDGVVCIGR
jgi:hypothetical protein